MHVSEALLSEAEMLWSILRSSNPESTDESVDIALTELHKTLDSFRGVTDCEAEEDGIEEGDEGPVKEDLEKMELSDPTLDVCELSLRCILCFHADPYRSKSHEPTDCPLHHLLPMRRLTERLRPLGTLRRLQERRLKSHVRSTRYRKIARRSPCK